MLVDKHTEKKLKISLCFNKNRNFTGKIKIFKIKNVKFPGNYVNINTNI